MSVPSSKIDVDERHPEHREPAHVGDVGRADQLRDDRVRDLILDQRRAAAHPLGEDDDLRVGEIRDGVQLRALAWRPIAPTTASATATSTSTRLRAQNSMIRSTMTSSPTSRLRDDGLAVLLHRAHPSVLDLARAAGPDLFGKAIGVEVLRAVGPLSVSRSGPRRRRRLTVDGGAQAALRIEQEVAGRHDRLALGEALR